MKELTGEYPVSSENSYASNAELPTSVSQAAVTALLSMHVEEQETSHGQENVSQKIKDARQKYLQQAGTAGKANSTAQFDDKVIDLLVQRLSERTRLFYRRKTTELNQAVNNGTFTKYRYNQEMAHFLRDVMDPGAYYLESEVTNALSLIGNEEGDVVDRLFYLFKRDTSSDLRKEMDLFDNILNEIVNNKKFGDPENQKRIDYQRNFIAKAREKLADRLPEPDRTEYFKFEQEQRKNLSQGRIDYDTYRDRILEWIRVRPLQEGLKKALTRKNDTERAEILAQLLKKTAFTITTFICFILA